MSNIALDIRDQLRTQLQAELPTFTEALYKYDHSQNNYTHNEKIFSIIPDAANSVSGSTRTITVDQDFLVRLSTEFKNIEDTDNALDTALFSLYEAHETLYRVFYQRNLSISRVMVVSELALDAPEINNENSIVTIQARYRIKYRTE